MRQTLVAGRLGIASTVPFLRARLRRVPLLAPPADSCCLAVQIGGIADDAEVAGLALGYLGDHASRPALAALPARPLGALSRALLGEPERLRRSDFELEYLDADRVRAAVDVVVGCRGRVGLGWACAVQYCPDSAANAAMFEGLQRMLDRQGTPGREQVSAARSLDALQRWCDAHGSAYLEGLAGASRPGP